MNDMGSVKVFNRILSAHVADNFSWLRRSASNKKVNSLTCGKSNNRFRRLKRKVAAVEGLLYVMTSYRKERKQE